MSELASSPVADSASPHRTVLAPVSVSLASGGEQAVWDDYVSAHPQASPYHHWAFAQVAESAFGHRVHLLLARRGETVCGVLPLVELNSRLFGHFVVSVPFYNYGGPLADDDQVEQALIDFGCDQTDRLGASHLELRMMCPPSRELPVKTDKAVLLLDLPDSSEALWNGFKSKLRSQIRRPMKEGMTGRIGRGELVDDFYEVFARNMRDLGTPVYSRDFFITIMRHWPDCFISVVYQGQQPVGAGFLIGHRGRLEIPWASTLRRFNRHSPNMLLYWQNLEWACDNGYRQFDFGRSSVDASTYRFKTQWGAQPSQCHWAYWLRDGGELPQMNPSNPRYRLAIAVWKRLPVGLTRLIGPHLVKYLP